MRQPRPGLRVFLANLRWPMPLRAKARLLLTAPWRRLAARRACCGRPGQPGC